MVLEVGRSVTTPPQKEGTEKGFPVPIWFAIALMLGTVAIFFGPALMAGNEGIVTTETISTSGVSGETGTNFVPVETDSEIGDGDSKVKVLDTTPKKFLDYRTVGNWKDYHRVDNFPDAIGYSTEFGIPLGSTVVTDLSVIGTVISFTVLKTEEDRSTSSEGYRTYPLHVGMTYYTTEGGEFSTGLIATVSGRNDFLPGESKREVLEMNPLSDELPESFKIVAVKITPWNL